MSDISNKVIEAFTGESIFEGVDTKVLKDFTQVFYERVVISAKNMKESKVEMYPYSENEETKKKIQSEVEEYNTTEAVLVDFRCSENQAIYLTDTGLYFNMFDLLEDCNKTGVVPCDCISSLEIVKKGDYFCFNCNGVLLVTDDVKNKDFADDVDIKEYFKRITEKDFSVTVEDMKAGVERHITKMEYDILKRLTENEDYIYIARDVDGCNVKDKCLCFSVNKVFEIREGKLYKKFKFSDVVYDADGFYLRGGGNRIYTSGYYYSRQANAFVRYLDEIKEKEKKEKEAEEELQKQVEKLMKLKTIGLITDEEFEEKRKSILEKMGI